MAAILGMLLPWPATMVLAFHEAGDHASPHVDLAATLHGHDHSHGTPDHDHSRTVLPTATSAQTHHLIAAMLRGEPVAWVVLGHSVSWQGEAPSETASPPPGSRSPQSVLRI